MTSEDWSDVWRYFRRVATSLAGPTLDEPIWLELAGQDYQWWLRSFDDPQPGSPEESELRQALEAIARGQEIGDY